MNYSGIILLSTFTISIITFENNRISATAINLLFTDEKHNIMAAGDWYCNQETQRTIDNVVHANPDLIITTGDHVKDVASADCWIGMSKHLKDRIKIAVGITMWNGKASIDN